MTTARPAPATRFHAVNGIDLAVHEWASEGTGVPLVFAHATGFHGRVWDAIVARFPAHPVYAIDLRGHGLSRAAPITDWRMLASDVAGFLAQAGLSGAIGIGHSMGAHTLLQTAADHPAAFSRLVRLVLLAVLVSSVNAMMRYGFDMSSNAWLEAQWYMYAAIVMLGASYTLKRNEHVRVDILYMMLSRRGQILLDIAGIIVFMLPACILLGWLSLPFAMQSFHMNEWSSNAGGLLRWPVKFLIPVGFGLLTLQGISELIKRVAALNGHDIPDLEAHYERPVQ